MAKQFTAKVTAPGDIGASREQRQDLFDRRNPNNLRKDYQRPRPAVSDCRLRGRHSGSRVKLRAKDAELALPEAR